MTIYNYIENKENMVIAFSFNEVPPIEARARLAENGFLRDKDLKLWVAIYSEIGREHAKDIKKVLRKMGIKEERNGN